MRKPEQTPDELAPPGAERALARMLKQPWWRALPLVVGVLALCTAICAVIEPAFDPANLIMVYLAGVVFVAVRRGHAAALLMVVGSLLLFDLIYVPPRWSLKPTDPQYFFTFAMMLIVGLVISQLAARSRAQALAAESRARRAQALNQLALALAMARSGQAVAAALAHSAERTLGAKVALLLSDETGRLADPGGRFADELDVARKALAQRAETGAGTSIGPGARAHYLPLLAAEGPLGVIAVEPRPGQDATPEDHQLLRAFANQTAVALERAVFEQRSATAAVQAETERLRNTLLTGISHDFRTPLTTIVGAATTLLEQGHMIDADHRVALLRSVLAEARRMHALSSDLLDLTRMEEGAVRPIPEWCPADELIDEARAALGARLDGHRLAVEVDADAVVWCDPRLVGQVLVNLLDNAARHTPAGGTIKVSVVVNPGDWHLVVHDGGTGLAAGLEREVFKKFFRGQQATESNGAGLGLAICSVVAQLHGGTIVASNDGGARFEMTLPQPVDDR